jgi:hypothetical protein
MSHVRAQRAAEGTTEPFAVPARGRLTPPAGDSKRPSLPRICDFSRKICVVAWQHCCSGELYDCQTSDHRNGTHAFRVAGLWPGAAALAVFLSGQQQRAKLGWTELGRRPGVAGAGTGSPLRVSTIGGPTPFTAGSRAATAPGSSAAASGIGWRSGSAIGHAAKRAKRAGFGTGDALGGKHD